MEKTKNSMTSLDVLSLRRELSVLDGGYVDKAFGGNPFSVRFNTGKGKKELVVYDGLFAFISDPLEKEEGAEIGPLAASIRRRLDNSRVVSVLQRGFDRLIVLKFSKPEGASLVLELMGKGNLILLDGDRVISSTRSEKRKGHEVFAGSTYEFPGLRFDILSTRFEEFSDAVRKSKGDMVRTLATVVGLGGDFAEEVCASLSIDFSTNPADLPEPTLRRIHETIMSIIERAEKEADPGVYYRAGRAVQFTPFPFSIYALLERKRFGSISECVLEFVKNRPEEVEEDQRTARLIQRQKEAIGKFRHEMEVTRVFADSIYTDYDGFKSALSAMKSGRQGKLTYSKNTDGTCTVLVEDVAIVINPQDEVNRVVSSIYDMSKELERKIRRAEEALDEIISRKEEKPKAVKAPELRKSRKKFWFDNYRWFVSSEGCLVISGRDARSNDSLVSRHMSDVDRYAHADVYGAPSVVVKWQEGAGEKTLEEACAFALCFSRAWNAQIGAAPAYWVMPDQVSKTPESGEHLPRGAFVIRGKRNYFSKLNLELALGVMEYAGEKRLVCAPESAVAAHAVHYYRLRPGDKTKEVVAQEIASILGVTRDDVVSVLPPGKSAYSEKT